MAVIAARDERIGNLGDQLPPGSALGVYAVASPSASLES